MIEAITKKQVAIVSFDRDLKNAKLLDDLGHPAPRVVTYQVTLDPGRLSPEGQFVRFGQGHDGLGQADEITGWVLLDDLTIEEILAEHDGEAFRPYVVESAVRAAEENHMTTIAKLMGSGTPAAQAQNTTAGVPALNLTAAGTTQANATAITSDFSVFATVPASSGARLPVANAASMTALAGDIYVVVNASATTMLVYPPTGGSFVDAAASASLAGGKTGDFYCIGGNVWAPSVGG